eukprot:1107176-Rhodomonas_salina.6
MHRLRCLTGPVSGQIRAYDEPLRIRLCDILFALCVGVLVCRRVYLRFCVSFSVSMRVCVSDFVSASGRFRLSSGCSTTSGS